MKDWKKGKAWANDCECAPEAPRGQRCTDEIARCFMRATAFLIAANERRRALKAQQLPKKEG